MKEKAYLMNTSGQALAEPPNVTPSFKCSTFNVQRSTVINMDRHSGGRSSLRYLYETSASVILFIINYVRAKGCLLRA
jgi:hypothetical protein